jgi:uncharacterized protein YjbI with pentapeptide repeats
MANTDHLRRLLSSREEFLRWRVEHDWELIDLSQAGIAAHDLDFADLRNADLAEAEFSGATLRWAGFKWSRLRGTRFISCNMRASTFNQALLEAVVFENVDLRDCFFERTLLQSVTFSGVKVAGSEWGGAILANCDLSGLDGLSDAYCSSPVSIGIDSLVLTLDGNGGHFSGHQRDFLVRAGTAPVVLDYLPSLVETRPIQFFSCFVSYGTEDRVFADKLYRDLKRRGIRCWKYDEDAIIGRRVWANIDRAIAGHEKTIVICSKSSLTRPGVQREIERALQKEDALKREITANPSRTGKDSDVLVPVRLDDYVLEEWEHERHADVIAHHVGDFKDWKRDASYEQAFQRLLRALDPRSVLGLSLAAGPPPERSS